MLGNFVAEQHRRALSLDVAEIRPVLGIADEGCEFRREGARDGRWIDQPLQLERFQPAEAVADDHTAPGRSGAVSAAAMEGRAEEQHGVSGPDLRHASERLGERKSTRLHSSNYCTARL